jgi:hypothetical protein
MLKTDQYQKNDVITIKLVTGEEIIGYFVDQDKNQITLRKPVVPVPTKQGQVGLAPFLMSSNYLEKGDDVPFNNSAVITTMKTTKEFAAAYGQQVSGIDMSAEAKPGLII